MHMYDYIYKYILRYIVKKKKKKRYIVWFPHKLNIIDDHSYILLTLKKKLVRISTK